MWKGRILFQSWARISMWWGDVWLPSQELLIGGISFQKLSQSSPKVKPDKRLRYTFTSQITVFCWTTSPAHTSSRQHHMWHNLTPPDLRELTLNCAPLLLEQARSAHSGSTGDQMMGCAWNEVTTALAHPWICDWRWQLSQSQSEQSPACPHTTKG